MIQQPDDGPGGGQGGPSHGTRTLWKIVSYQRLGFLQTTEFYTNYRVSYILLSNMNIALESV